MSLQVLILVATAVLAVVAVVAAVIAVRAVRQLQRNGDRVAGEERAAYRDHHPSSDLDTPLVPHEPLDQREPEAEVVRVVEGRVIVQPSQDQLVAATMTRPSVRLGILASGVAHALRPESRDRISALMRREYRGRRRARQRAARAAARSTNAPPTDGRGWVGS